MLPQAQLNFFWIISASLPTGSRKPRSKSSSRRHKWQRTAFSRSIRGRQTPRSFFAIGRAKPSSRRHRLSRCFSLRLVMSSRIGAMRNQSSGSIRDRHEGHNCSHRDLKPARDCAGLARRKRRALGECGRLAVQPVCTDLRTARKPFRCNSRQNRPSACTTDLGE